ncbi:MAG: hypothetical protein ACOC23_02510 [Thermodesulfobacteriota bacterium]
MVEPMIFFKDRIHRLPRVWTNRELKKFAHFFHGEIANVSGWKDIDKEGKRYRDYFINASAYTITNYKTDKRGFQGFKNEVFLDLEKTLPESLYQKFDVVFNHTTLEHIYNIKKAFQNLCNLSKDIVIIVVPFLQQYHSDYGDYWRFTPLAIQRMFRDNDFELLYQSFNSNKKTSVYIFTIASRNPEKWKDKFDWSFTCRDPKGKGVEPFIGCNAIPNTAHKYYRFFSRLMKLSKP